VCGSICARLGVDVSRTRRVEEPVVWCWGMVVASGFGGAGGALVGASGGLGCRILVVGAFWLVSWAVGVF